MYCRNVGQLKLLLLLVATADRSFELIWKRHFQPSNSFMKKPRTTSSKQKHFFFFFAKLRKFYLNFDISINLYEYDPSNLALKYVDRNTANDRLRYVQWEVEEVSLPSLNGSMAQWSSQDISACADEQSNYYTNWSKDVIMTYLWCSCLIKPNKQTRIII